MLNFKYKMRGFSKGTVKVSKVWAIKEGQTKPSLISREESDQLSGYNKEAVAARNAELTAKYEAKQLAKVAKRSK